MGMVLIGAAVVLWLAVVGGYLRFDREKLAEQVTRLSGGALVVVAIFLALIGRELAAAATAIVGLTIMGAATDAVSNIGYSLGRRVRDVMGLFGLAGIAGGRQSVVRSHFVEIVMSEARGIVGGRVLAGTFTGRVLTQMSTTDLAILRREISADGNSLMLLDAYLDGRQPGWREDLKFDPRAGAGGAARPGEMTEQEAHEILGLEAGATLAEVRDAHRRLIKMVHPDVGGSAFLAAKINEAKDRLIRRHS